MFLVYAAVAYRSADDVLPGIGCAWDPSGMTPYTKNSELQNAETSAWGRAIVASLASESKAVASAEDVRNRQAEREVEPAPAWQAFGYADDNHYETVHNQVIAAWAQLDEDQVHELRAWLVDNGIGRKWPVPLSIAGELFERVKAPVAQNPTSAPDSSAVASEQLAAGTEPEQPSEVSQRIAALQAVKPAPSVADIEKLGAEKELETAIARVAKMPGRDVTHELKLRSLSPQGNEATRRQRLALAVAHDAAMAKTEAQRFGDKAESLAEDALGEWMARDGERFGTAQERDEYELALDADEASGRNF